MEKVEYDLQQVRSVLDRAEEAGGPASIYWLWAAICLVGFSLHDLQPKAAAIFWPIAGPMGGVLSFALGWRWGRNLGQGSLRIARYHALHWFGIMVSIVLIVLLEARGVISSHALPHIILVLLAYGWFSAGIHLVRDYLWIGIAMAAGFLCLLLVDGFGWIGVGALLSTSLAWAGWRGGRRGGRAIQTP